jgi:hypothetical protein
MAQLAKYISATLKRPHTHLRGAMRSVHILVAALFLVTLVAAPVSAQQVVTTATSQIFAMDTKDGTGVYQQIFWVPNKTWRGSYTKSCPQRLPDSDFNPNSTAAVNTVRLNMVCLAEDGKKITTALVAYEFCLTDVYNDNGHLKCRLPSGSYQATCRNAEMINGGAPSDFRPGANYLYADCQRRDGSYQPTSLNAQFTSNGCLYHFSTFGGFYSNGGDIANLNGALTCVPPQPTQPTCSVPGPGGACTVASGGNRGAVIGNGYSCGPEGADLPGCTP